MPCIRAQFLRSRIHTLCPAMKEHRLPALVAVILSVSVSADVMVGPVRNPTNGHDYYLIEPTSWLGAQIEAQRMDGHLAVIETAAENQWIADTFNRFGVGFWIGYHDSRVEGQFRAVNGTLSTFRNFAPNQPDNDQGEDYVEMWVGGVWNDRNAVSVIPGLVEVAPLPEILAGPVRNPSNGSTYYLLSDSSWLRAQAKARALGGNLATISSESENAWVLASFGSWDPAQPAILWIGFTDEGQEGSFRWISGEANRFVNWRGGEPNNALGGENYVNMWPDGTWNDFAARGEVGIEYLRLGVVEVDRPVLEIRVTEVELNWNARFGKLYQVQQLATATGAQWTDVGQPYLGKDGFLTIKVPVPADGAGGLFRVVELP